MTMKEEGATRFEENKKRAALVCAVHVAALLVVTGSCPSQGLADDEDSAAAQDSSAPSDSPHPLAEGAAPGDHCDEANTHPHDGQDACNTGDAYKIRSPEKGNSSGNAELASKLANPSAPMLALNFFLDLTQSSGSVPGAQQASLRITFQPTLPFPTPKNKGNLFFRPAIPADFSSPIPETQADGTVALGSQPAAFGNVGLDTLFGKTWPFGLLFMGGANTTFPTHSKKALRAPWTFGPELVIGFASKRTGNLWGTIINYLWTFPEHNQIFSGQYFYNINLSPKGWALNAAPVFTYSRETKTLRFPLGLGIAKTGLVGKMPLKLGVQVWAYTPPPDQSGPEWTVRFLITPVVRRPW